MTHVTALLIQAAHVPSDTVITKLVPSDVGIFQTIISGINGLMALAFLMLALGILLAARELRKTYNKVNALLDRVYGDVAPLIRSAGVATDDAREIVAVVKGDVRQVQQTVAAANARLLKAVKEAEARLDEFNALIEVVQDEAESAFVSTASTVHGVRTGLAQVFDNTEEFEDGDDRHGSAADTGGTDAPNRPRTTSRRRGGLA